MQDLQFSFTLPQYGWIQCEVTHGSVQFLIGCSAVCDPFEDLIAWLEQIVLGAANPVWEVGEEGSSARLIFLWGCGANGDGQSYLVCCRSGGGVLDDYAAAPIDRAVLVRKVYGAFLSMIEHPAYDPRHWEIHPCWHEVDQDDEQAFDAAIADWPFSGQQLRFMRSPVVEQFLREADQPARQLELKLSAR